MPGVWWIRTFFVATNGSFLPITKDGIFFNLNKLDRFVVEVEVRMDYYVIFVW